MPLKPAPANHLRLPAIALATVLLGGLAVLGGSVVQQVRMAPSAVPPSMATAKQGARDAGLPVDPSGPAWGELTAAQKRALAPLEQRWSRMGDVQKRRWLALARRRADALGWLGPGPGPAEPEPEPWNWLTPLLGASP